jgi:hypothetical protein
MADRLVADVMVERLKAWGVNRVFGYSGDGINGFMGALRRSMQGGGTGSSDSAAAVTVEPASNSCRPGTRKPRRSWPSGTPSTRAGWAW